MAKTLYLITVFLIVGTAIIFTLLPNLLNGVGFSSPEEYAQKYQFANFAGMDINYNEFGQLDIYGTVKIINSETTSLELLLKPPDYLIDSSVGAKYFLIRDKFAKTVKIWLETETKFFDPYTANQPVTFAEIKNTKDKRILTTFTGAYVYIKAEVDDQGGLVAREISIATIQ